MKRKISLKLIFIIPFSILLIVISGLIGYFYFKNVKSTVYDLVFQLSNEISQQIDNHIINFMKTPTIINQFNSKQIRNNVIDPDNKRMIQDYFYEQIQGYPTVTSIYFGNNDGGLVGCGHEGDNKTYYFTETTDLKSGVFNKYLIDSQKGIKDKVLSFPNFDARVRPWYTKAIAQKSIVWSDIYILFTGQDMAIASSVPVYDDNNEAIGVLSIDIFLSQISNYLKSLIIGKTGSCYILEKNGLLVASSTKDKLIMSEKGKKSTRLEIGKSDNKILQKLNQVIVSKYSSLNIIKDNQLFSAKIDNKKYFINVKPIRDECGLDWLILLIIPESDFMTQIKKINNNTLSIIIISTIIVILLGLLLTHNITKPIIQIIKSTQSILQGKWHYIDTPINIVEIDKLKNAINKMTKELEKSFTNLKIEVQERKIIEKNLIKEKEFIDIILNAIRDTFFIFDIETGKAIRWNKVFSATSGYTDDEIILKKAPDEYYSKEDLEKASKSITRVLNEGYDTLELSLITKSGQEIPTEYSAAIINDDNEKPKYIIAIGRDITERKKNEEKIKNTLKEKETLLRELYHRTKNNMNVISSFLKLQKIFNPEEKLEKVINDTVGRIHSMSLVHEKLYKSKNLSKINFKSYLTDLVYSISKSYNSTYNKIKINLDLENIDTLFDIAIPLGLVANEIITNIYKYAFPDDEEGIINIKLILLPSNLIELTISDNGVGLKEGLSIDNTKSLGFIIINDIVIKQLQGTLKVHSNNGLWYTITVKNNLYSERV